MEREKRRKRQQNVKLYTDILAKKANKCYTRMVVYYSLLWSVCFIVETWKSHELCAEKKKEKKGEKEKKRK